MTIKDESGEVFSKRVLDWLTGLITLAAALTTIFGVFFTEEKAKPLAFGVAFLLVLASGGVFLYQRRKAAKLKIAESLEPLAPSATLRGLLPFEDGDELPGRARDIQGLYTLVTSADFRFGVLWGESGCGKTSLLRAGLVPKLRNEKFLPLYISKPTMEPQEAIRAALNKETEQRGKQADKDLKQLLKAVAPKGKKIVILFDQFEEFFLINRTKRSRAGFIKWLGEAIKDDELPVVFLIGIRADFFAQLQNLAPQIPEPTSIHTTYQLQNFDTEQAQQIFSAAAKADGIPFEPELIQAVIHELESEDFIRPAELQVVGTRLKRKNITRASQYEALGGSRGILSSYISDEIKQSPNDQTARLVLRLMCAESVETKSPTDLSMTDILRGIGSTESTPNQVPLIRPQVIQSILNQFVAARVLIHTDEDKYNLAHDYLAPYVRTATEGTETNTEQANRLLKRYVAEYKEDIKARIPFQRVRWLEKYASPEAKNRDKAQELIEKSKQAFFGKLRLGIGVPIVIVLLLYIYASNSYYVSAGDFSKFDESTQTVPYFVIRTGSPKLKFLPGLDNAVIETDISFEDYNGLGQNFMDLLSYKFESRLTGPWFRKTDEGYQQWIEQILPDLTPSAQARIRRLLNQPEITEEILINTILDPEVDYTERLKAAGALTQLAQLHPEIVTSETAQKLIDFITTPVEEVTVQSNEVSVQTSTAIVLRQLVQANPEILTQYMLEETLDFIANPESNAAIRSNTIDTVGKTIQASHPDLIPRMMDELVSIVGDSKTDASVRASATNSLKQLLQASDVVTPDVSEALLYVSDASPTVKSNFADILAQLFQYHPESASSDSLKSLFSYAVDVQIDVTSRTNVQTAIKKIAQDDPKLITPDLLEILVTFITTQYADPTVRTNTQDMVVTLARANPEAVTSEILQKMIDFIMNQQADFNARSSMRNSALTALAQDNPKAIDAELIQKLIVIFFNSEDDPFASDWAGFTLQPLIEANPQAVAPGYHEQLVTTIADPETFDSLRIKAGYLVGPLVKSNPGLVSTEKLELLAGLINDEKINNNLRVAASNALGKFAKVRPEAVTPDLISSFLEIIVSPQSNVTTRSNASNALVSIVQADPDAFAPGVLERLQSILANSQTDPNLRGSLESTLSQIAQLDSKLITDELFQALWDSLQIDLDRTNRPEYLLSQLARVNAQVVTPERIRKFTELIKDPQANSAIRASRVYTLGQLAQANPKVITADMEKTIEKMVRDTEAETPMRSNATDALLTVVNASPKLITPEFVNVLTDLIANPQTEGYMRTRLIYTLGQIAQDHPKAITTELTPALIDLVGDPENAPYLLSTDALSALEHLPEANPRIINPELLQTLIDLTTDEQINQLYGYSLIGAIGQLAKINHHAVTPEILQEMIVKISSTNTEPYIRSNFVNLLGQLSQANPQAITPDVLQPLLDSVMDPETDRFIRAESAKILGKFVRLNPQAGESVETIPALLNLLKQDTDSTGRGIAAYAIYQLTFKDQDQKATIHKVLNDEFLTSPKPHLRIAAMRVLELMEISDLVDEENFRPENAGEIKDRVNNLIYTSTYYDEYIQYAASVALEEINAVELEQQKKQTDSQPEQK